MFKASYNRAVLRLKLTTVTPLSIRAGDVGLDPSSSDLVCIRTRHAQRGRTVFVPGSGLKGVVRSSAEAMLRGADIQNAACDPAAHRQNCGTYEPERGEPDGAGVHKKTCLACRLFGSTAMKARCSVRDLFPFEAVSGELSEEQERNRELANKVEVRPGVLIGRIEGSVKHGPFEQEMVPAGVSFWGDVALENFQAWQLGLLVATLQELDEGFLQLGSGKSKGLGVVRAEVLSLLHEQRAGAGVPSGVGALVAREEAERYGLLAEVLFPAAQGKRHGLMDRFLVAGDSLNAWKEAGLAGLEKLTGAAR